MIDSANSKTEPLSALPDPPRMIRVLAPSSLPPGYELHVESTESEGFTVIVPQGGVREGDIFLAPIPHGYKMEELTDVPTGKWKDGICDLFRYGVCQPALFCAFFCTDIAMGQIMQRMRLSWTGNRTVGGRALNTFRTVLILCVCYGIFDTALGVYIAASMNVTENGYYYYYVSNVSPAIPIIRNVVGVLFTLWSIYALYKTRQNVRSEFSIPEEQCIGYEDCVCATFCGCCTIAQIARHTGDYDRNQGLFCSETGLPAHVAFAAPMTV